MDAARQVAGLIAAAARGGRPLVMGILNVTPDSFSDGGRHAGPDAALAHAARMVDEGADIIDVGGESTRPGARAVGVAEELDRVLPVVESVVATLGVPVSVDTSKPEVMRAAAAAGAAMLNDVTALAAAGARETAAELGLPVCLMHMQGEPRTMQEDPRYGDVVAEVRDYLAGQARAAEAAGVEPGRIVVDPGFGFGKRLAHNLALLRDLRSITDLGYPVLVGLSRKSMIGKLIDRPVEQRDAASAALALLAVQRGAAIVRVHDVAGTRDALAMAAALDRHDTHGEP